MFKRKKHTWEIAKTFEGTTRLGGCVTRVWYRRDDGKVRVKDLSGDWSRDEIERLYPKP